MTLEELAARTFVTVPEAACILGADERTVRRSIQAGDIPATRIGARHMVPVTWLREQAGMSGDRDEPVQSQDDALTTAIAERVAERVGREIARIFGALAQLGDSADSRRPDGPEKV